MLLLALWEGRGIDRELQDGELDVAGQTKGKSDHLAQGTRAYEIGRING